MAFNRQLFDSINRKYKKAHDEITDLYYNQKKLTKEQFEILHELVWALHEKERYDYGFYTDKGDKELPDEVLNNAEWQQEHQKRVNYITNRISELQNLKASKCKGFKYTFEE